MSGANVIAARPRLVRETVDFARRDGEASAEQTVYGLNAVLGALNDELCSGSVGDLDEGRLVGLSIAARILGDNLADRIGNCPPNAPRTQEAAR